MIDNLFSPYSVNIANTRDPRVFSEIYRRTNLIDDRDYAFIYKMRLDSYYGICATSYINLINKKTDREIWNKEKFYLLEDAKNYLDNLLLKHGYVLLTQEQWDKLSILV